MNKTLILIGTFIISWILIGVISSSLMQYDDGETGAFIGFVGAIGLTLLIWGLI